MQFRADVYFKDEAPRIGCGWRRCLLRVGPKWVRFQEEATGKAVRLARRQLDGRTMRRFDLLDYLKPREVA